MIATLRILGDDMEPRVLLRMGPSLGAAGDYSACAASQGRRPTGATTRLAPHRRRRRTDSPLVAPGLVLVEYLQTLSEVVPAEAEPEVEIPVVVDGGG